MTRLFLLLSLTILAGAESHATQASVQSTDSRIEYRKNQYSYDANFGTNSAAARSITRTIQNAGEENIDFIRIVTYVTPTSSEENDLALAEKRAVDTKWLIAEKFPKLQGRVIYETRRSSREGDVSIVSVCLKNEMERKTFTLSSNPSIPSQRQASRKRTVRSLPLDITSTTGDMFKDVRTDNPDVYALEAHLDYKVNEYTFDPNYMSNRAVLRALDRAIDEVGIDNIDSVLVVSTASPEGTVEHNLFLAEKRAIDSKWFILSQYPELRDRISHEGRGESWEGLRQLVESDRNITNSTRYQLLDIIGNNYVDANTKKALLRKIPNDPMVGNVYQYVLKNHFPSLRGTTMLSFYLKPQQAEPAYQEVVIVPVETPEVKEEPVVVEQVAPIEEPVEVKPKAKETFFALKTNLLYDAVTMVNAEIEVPIGKRFSIMVEDVFPWWEFQKNKYALQNWEIGVETRFWFKKWGYDDRKLLGFFVGPYGMSGKGDIQWDKDLCYQATYLSAGLSGGFVIPLGKKKHWGNMEFSLSAGWLRANYQHYQPAADYSVLIRDPYNAGQVTYFGPTKLKVSLVIPINFATKRAAKYAETHSDKK
ncbi:MAG: DUF3575 domain-containing protein [Bacteroidia bacterium]|nr:DUF3575 domain-containing protein [Bacteroidia bacterium]